MQQCRDIEYAAYVAYTEMNREFIDGVNDECSRRLEKLASLDEAKLDACRVEVAFPDIHFRIDWCEFDTVVSMCCQLDRFDDINPVIQYLGAMESDVGVRKYPLSRKSLHPDGASYIKHYRGKIEILCHLSSKSTCRRVLTHTTQEVVEKKHYRIVCKDE